MLALQLEVKDNFTCFINFMFVNHFLLVLFCVCLSLYSPHHYLLQVNRHKKLLNINTPKPLKDVFKKLMGKYTQEQVLFPTN